MMDRAHFTAEFRRTMRFVIQKMEREREAMGQRYATSEYKRVAVDAAQANTDAAIDQLADHVMDALEHMLEP